MSGGAHQEREFQKHVVAHLADNGWLHSTGSEGYDKERALFVPDLLAWIEDAEPVAYAKLVPADASEAARAKGEARILDRVAKELSQPLKQGGGTLNVLRGGVKIPGVRDIALMQVPPADDRNPNLTARYAKNRLRVVEELVYSTRNANRIDLAFFLNGLPVATAELKTSFTQTLEHAKAQYRNDRLPQGEPLLTPTRGALVHFAVTDTRVAMTTTLEGPKTFFLPFDQGRDGGAGNPVNEHGHATSYLWEQILQRDAWLIILSKFVYTHESEKVDLSGKVTKVFQTRFPRFHQWRAVTALAAAAAEEGPGHRYLIQHSAGSGKTDSIAWTAHRLASLHNADGKKVFDTVFVISDRQVLDKQLRDAVKQLERTAGTFEAITSADGSKTSRLKEVLTSGTAHIVGVTLQTFPHALEALKDPANQERLRGKHFAVVADEAHSSQSGNAAKAVKELLYSADPSGAALDMDEPGADQDALAAMAAHADADHRLSYFAFTATPKEKTLELFGRRNPVTDELEAFDLYPMKQAIEEGFILDVLKNYTSYEMAARIALNGADRQGGDGTQPSHSTSGIDVEEIDVRQGTKAYINFVELHPTNVASKVEVILDHYLHSVQHHLGGRAKAMVVTESRAAAVRYKRAFEKIIARRGLNLNALVAFSGEVEDPDRPALHMVGGGSKPGKTVTEASENTGLHGQDLASVFAQDGQHFLIVANKYQTGFDQPLLVGMYVDKALSGIAAVQTLSRLNRVAPGKTDTYVLDFVNEPEQILESFKTYYTAARIETESDPDLVANLIKKLEYQRIFTWPEVDAVFADWTSRPNQASRKHAQLSAHLQPAVNRFEDFWKQAILQENTERRDELLDFKAVLTQYVTAYAFFSQILDFGDPLYEKMSVFADLLARSLAGYKADSTAAEAVSVSDVVLTHFKLDQIAADADLGLSATGEDVPGLVGMTEAGLAKVREAERKGKAEVVEKVNKYFGDLDPNDVTSAAERFERILESVAQDPSLQLQAANNSREDLVHSPGVLRAIEDAQWKADETEKRITDFIQAQDPKTILQFLMREMDLYGRLRNGSHTACRTAATLRKPLTI